MKFLRYIPIFALAVAFLAVACNPANSETENGYRPSLIADQSVVCERIPGKTTGWTLAQEIAAATDFGHHVIYEITDRSVINWVVLFLGGNQWQADNSVLLLVWSDPKGMNSIIESFDDRECHVGGMSVPMSAVYGILKRAGHNFDV